MPLLQQEQLHFAQRFRLGRRLSWFFAWPHEQKILREQWDLGQMRRRDRQRDDCRIQSSVHHLLNEFGCQRLANVNVEFEDASLKRGG